MLLGIAVLSWRDSLQRKSIEGSILDINLRDMYAIESVTKEMDKELTDVFTRHTVGKDYGMRLVNTTEEAVRIATEREKAGYVVKVYYRWKKV